MEELTRGYVSQIEFNNGETLKVTESDIIVFVGPNNAGKSQALKDIYALSQQKSQSVVVSDVKVSMNGIPVNSLLEKVAKGQDLGWGTQYQFLGHTITYSPNSDTGMKSEQRWGQFYPLFMANLNTEARLSICSPPKSIVRNEAKTHPIHFAAYDGKKRKWLSESFKRAFNTYITPNILNGATIPLCIGEPVLLNEEYEDEQTRLEVYAEKLEDYQQVQNQGDGMKSFTGILLYLMLNHFCTYLIDEPESFLHPPQARILGQIIGNTLTNTQQAFISTHSEDIIVGLMDICPERLRIIRITRNGNTNSFAILNNGQFANLWSDPLLKYSNIMASLFHSTAVLCESDSDCKFYAAIESHLKQLNGRYSEALFIHCGGKHRMAKIVSAIRALKIDVKLITDIDVLNQKNVFTGIVKAFGLEFSEFEADYNNIVSNLHSPKEKIKRSEAKSLINNILDQSVSTDLTSREITMINDAVKTISKWEGIKKGGYHMLPAGSATASYEKIDKLLRSVGIFLVPVGEVECFVKKVGGHGPEWVNHVFEEHPDLNDNVYAAAREFVASLNL